MKRWRWPRACALKELSDPLGDDHDLAVFNAMPDHLPDEVTTTSELDRLRHQVVERRRARSSERVTEIKDKAMPSAASSGRDGHVPTRYVTDAQHTGR